jgi:RND family efflux transporter MFP subunit
MFVPGCKKKSIPAPKIRPLAVRMVPVRLGQISEGVTYVGTLHSRQEIRILARIAGKVADLPVAEGDEAKKGTVLARISAPETRARIAKMQAEIARVKTESDFACSQAKTDQKLLKSKAISRIRADASMQKCRSSQAALKALKAGLDELRLVAARSQETAPFEGRVLQWISRPGENIMPGRPILLFGGRDLEIRVMVQERDLGKRVRQGEPVVLMPGTKKETWAKVGSIAPMAMGPGRLVEVKIPITLKQARTLGLGHGMSVDVKFVTKQKKDALLVPASCVKRTNGKSVLFKVHDDHLKAVPVDTGLRAGQWIEIVTTAIRPEDQVVSGNLDMLKDGMLVYPVTESKTKEGAAR